VSRALSLDAGLRGFRALGGEAGGDVAENALWLRLSWS